MPRESLIVKHGLAKTATDLLLANKPVTEISKVLSDKVGVRIAPGMVKSFKRVMARGAALELKDQFVSVESYAGNKFLDSVEHVKRNIDELYAKRIEFPDDPELFVKLVAETRQWIELSVRMMGELKSVGTQIQNQQVNVFTSPEFFGEFEKYLKSLHVSGKIVIQDRDLLGRCGL